MGTMFGALGLIRLTVDLVHWKVISERVSVIATLVLLVIGIWFSIAQAAKFQVTLASFTRRSNIKHHRKKPRKVT